MRLEMSSLTNFESSDEIPPWPFLIDTSMSYIIFSMYLLNIN